MLFVDRVAGFLDTVTVEGGQRDIEAMFTWLGGSGVRDEDWRKPRDDGCIQHQDAAGVDLICFVPITLPAGSADSGPRFTVPVVAEIYGKKIAFFPDAMRSAIEGARHGDAAYGPRCLPSLLGQHEPEVVFAADLPRLSGLVTARNQPPGECVFAFSGAPQPMPTLRADPRGLTFVMSAVPNIQLVGEYGTMASPALPAKAEGGARTGAQLVLSRQPPNGMTSNGCLGVARPQPQLSNPRGTTAAAEASPPVQLPAEDMTFPDGHGGSDARSLLIRNLPKGTTSSSLATIVTEMGFDVEFAYVPARGPRSSAKGALKYGFVGFFRSTDIYVCQQHIARRGDAMEAELSMKYGKKRAVTMLSAPRSQRVNAAKLPVVLTMPTVGDANPVELCMA